MVSGAIGSVHTHVVATALGYLSLSCSVLACAGLAQRSLPSWFARIHSALAWKVLLVPHSHIAPMGIGFKYKVVYTMSEINALRGELVTPTSFCLRGLFAEISGNFHTHSLSPSAGKHEGSCSTHW